MSRCVVVVGSLNLDRTYTMSVLPEEGESLHATGQLTSSGGKGANQAVAAAKLGGDVLLVGAVGTDSAGDHVLKAVAGAGVDTSAVRRNPDHPTGEAVIFVDADGRNLIVVSKGANAALSVADVGAISPQAAWVLSGFEVPDATVIAASEHARRIGAKFVLNPSPFRRIPDELTSRVDVMVLNEHELEAAVGTLVDVESDSALRGACRFLKVPSLVVTLGSRGAVVILAEGISRVPGVPVRAVDTSGAGDAFTGALLARLSAGDSVEAAVMFASEVGAFAATRPGTQSSYPTLQELERWRGLQPAT